MALFTPSFIDDLKSRASIVQIIQERVPLRRAGVGWKGLCPFHGEKTPSFSVNDEKGFFHCFGCGVAGDVIKFVELYDKVAFPDAVRQLASRVGLTVPEPEESAQEAENQREREALLKVHEVAAAFFRDQLETRAGTPARRVIEARGLVTETIVLLGMGYAPRTGTALRDRLLAEGFPPALLQKSGLVLRRDDGSLLDRFRGRLMIPIARETGPIIAFGGRALENGQNPKYLNSPETPIYVKGRTLYGLHLTKSAITQARYAVLVEGYFDVAQAVQAGVRNVVASSGTALTPVQARLLKRFAGKVVLSFDPDAAGQGAAARSSELLVTEGFQVNVATLPPGDDPDAFIQKKGGPAYEALLKGSKPWLDYLLDRSASDYDFGQPDARREFLSRMLTVAATIPDAAGRDQFADRVAHRAQITEEVVRAEIRKAAVQRKTTSPVDGAAASARREALKPVEWGLIWGLMRDPGPTLAALAELEPGDTDGLASRGILEQARSLQNLPPEALPDTLIERLTQGEAALVQEIGRQRHAPAAAEDCVRTLRRTRYDRERAAVQRQIDRLQEQGAAAHGSEIDSLWARKRELLQQIEALMGTG
jgi:DNA primase